MSDAGGGGPHKSKSKRCANFEPQTWRKTLCKNCFKTKDDHRPPGDGDDVTTSEASSAATSREGTPLHDVIRIGVGAGNATLPQQQKDDGVGVVLAKVAGSKKLVSVAETSGGTETSKADKTGNSPVVKDNKGKNEKSTATTVTSQEKITGGGTVAKTVDKPVLQKPQQQTKTGSTNGVTTATGGAKITQSPDLLPTAVSPPGVDPRQTPLRPEEVARQVEGDIGGVSGGDNAAADIRPTAGINNLPDFCADDAGKSQRAEVTVTTNCSTGVVDLKVSSSSRSSADQAQDKITPGAEGCAASAAESKIDAATVPPLLPTVESISAGAEGRQGGSGEEDSGVVRHVGEPPRVSSGAVDQSVNSAAAAAVVEESGAGWVHAGGKDGARPLQLEESKEPLRLVAEDQPLQPTNNNNNSGGSDVLFTSSHELKSAAAAAAAAADSETLASSSAEQRERLLAEIDSAVKSIDTSGSDLSAETGTGSSNNRSKVEATITLSGLPLSPAPVGPSNGIYVVSGSGNGLTTGSAADNRNQLVSPEPEFETVQQRGRLPDYYDQNSAPSGDDSILSTSFTSSEYEDQPQSFYFRRGGGEELASPGSVERGDAAGGGETSLFHHVPDDDGTDPNGSRAGWESSTSGRGRTDTDNRQQQQQNPAASRRRRRRIISGVDDPSMDGSQQQMSASELARSDAMMEGTRMLIDSLRDKVGVLEDRCEKMDREKLALSDLLVAKKSDYDRMRAHCSDRISDLEEEVQRLKSEKARLLDRLQLPESERASLAAEENEIAELKRKLEDYELRYGDAVAENEELQQEVRDLQLAMAELHDQFRDEETAELRELQRELEATAKACRISQFKLRKVERRCDQLDAERLQAEEKIRSLENCLQGSDDKRRLRLMEDELRMAKEAAVRLHDDMQRADERRMRHQEDLDRVKNTLNDSENRRMVLQNQLDNAQTELQKLREQLKFEGRLDLLKPTATSTPASPSTCSPEVQAAVSQLTRDLAASEERENDLREQLKFAEEESRTIRRKLTDCEEEMESMNLQLRKLSGVPRRGSGSAAGGSRSKDAEATELRLQMELAEQEVTVLRRKLGVLQGDNENLMTAVKYLRSKLEAISGGGGGSTGEGASRMPGASEELEACRAELSALRHRLTELETEKVEAAGSCSECERLRQQLAQNSSSSTNSPAADQGTNSSVETFQVREQRLLAELDKLRQQVQTPPANPDTSSTSSSSAADLQSKVEQLEKSLAEEKQKLTAAITERQKSEAELVKAKEDIQTQLTTSKADLKTAKADLKKAKDELKAHKDCKVKTDEIQKQLDALKKKSTETEAELKKCQEELKASKDLKSNAESLQKKFDELKQTYDKLLKETAEKEKATTKTSSAVGSSIKDREPVTWRLEKQELERQVKDLQKKCDDLLQPSTADSKKASTFASKSPKDSKNDSAGVSSVDCTKCNKEKTELRSKLEQAQKDRDSAVKEKEKLEASKKTEDAAGVKSNGLGGGLAQRSKFASLGKDNELAEKTKAVQDLTAKLEKKETEMKTLKFDKTTAECEVKKVNEKLQELQAKLDKTSADMDKKIADANNAREKLRTEVEQGKKELETNRGKLKELEEKFTKEKSRLEADLKQANEKLSTATTAAASTAATTSPVKGLKKTAAAVDTAAVERDALLKEKQKLTDDVSKLKKDLADVEKRSKTEKEELEKNVKEKTKLVDKLQAELDSLKAQVATAKTSSTSNAVVIPVQQEKSSSKSIPAQKSAPSSTPDELTKRIEEQEKRFQVEKSSLEEVHKTKTRTLEEQLGRTKQQLEVLKKDSDSLAAESKKSLADVKSRYEKELEAWKKEKEQLQKTTKQADEFKSRISVLDKSVEELTGKLKAEEAKRKELETKLKLAQNGTAATAEKSSAEQKAKTSVSTADEKTTTTTTTAKLSDFRSKFEKFGSNTSTNSSTSSSSSSTTTSTSTPKPGTPAPFRRNSGATAAAAASAPAGGESASNGDLLAELQKQVAEAEKTRVKDRQELLEKIGAQRKEFDSELQELKKKNTQLETKAQELSVVQKNVMDLRCQLDEEKSKLLTEKTRIQTNLEEALKARDEQRNKAAELQAEVAKLKVAAGQESKSAASTPAAKSPTVVIPIKRIGGDDKKTTSTASSDVTANDVTATGAAAADAKPLRKVGLFNSISATMEPGRTFGGGTPVKVAAAVPPRTIPITRVSRPGTPKV